MERFLKDILSSVALSVLFVVLLFAGADPDVGRPILKWHDIVFLFTVGYFMVFGMIWFMRGINMCVKR